MRAKPAAPVVPKAAAGGAAADSGAAPSASAARVKVPDLVGHGLGYVRTVTRANGLKWAYAEGTTCPPVPGFEVKRQSPAAGKTVAAGTTIRVSTGTCTR
jgi:beta-lactam-binding protein with PASTA domain